MPLRKLTKSALFYKGMTDDTERFLAKSPAVDYTENLYEERTGSYSKRPGFESLGYPVFSSTDPFMLHGVGDTLYTVSPDKGYYYDGSWGEIENNGDIRVRQQDVLARTHPKAGAKDFCFALVTGGYCVAFETRTHDASAVVVQSFSEDGTFRGEQRIDLATGPRLEATPGGDTVHLFYYAVTLLRHRLYDPGQNSLGAADSTAVFVSDKGAWSFRSSSTSAPEPSLARAGFTQSSFEDRNPPYHVAFTPNHIIGHVLYRVIAPAENLYIQRLAQNGVAIGAPFLVYEGSLFQNAVSSPLAIKAHPDGTKGYVLYVVRHTTGGPLRQQCWVEEYAVNQPTGYTYAGRLERACTRYYLGAKGP